MAVKANDWVIAKPPRFGESETVIPAAEIIVRDKLTDFDCCGLLESFTFTAKFEVPGD